MLWLLIYVAAAMGSALTLWGYKNQIRSSLYIAGYELVYWVLGTLAVGDDLIWGWKNKFKETSKRTGEVVVITGGARGIGLEVVKKLLECDMTVVLACRNVKAGEEAIKGIRAAGITTGQTDVMALDTASQNAVKTFAQLFLAKYDKLNILINNAGIMFVPYRLTDDGFEEHLAVNYLGHFTLTQMLLPALVRAARDSNKNSRVVNVSSCAHLPGAINFDDINYERTLYIPSQAYAQSKLAQIMFTKAVARRMTSQQLPVSLLALHPGVVNTDLFNDTFLKKFLPWMPSLFFKTPYQGAVTTVYAALSSDLEGRSGLYLANCRNSFVSSTARNEPLQEKLMKHTIKMLNLSDFQQ